MIDVELKKIFKKNILITGGAGFIGSNLVKFFVENGIRVSVLDDLSTGFIKNIEPYLEFLDFYNVDICDFSEVERTFKASNPDIIFHMAALPGVLNSIADPCRSNDINISGFLNILKLSSEFYSERVIFSSSSSVYGGASILPTPESAEKLPKSPYALQKLMCEEYCRIFSKLYNLDTVSLRYFNVFGPNQNPNSEYSAVIPAFCSCFKKSLNPKIYGSGYQYRDFCYVDNIVYANILAALKNKKINGDVFNVGTGDYRTINSLCETIGTKKPEYLPERAGDVFCSQADISKISSFFGYKPIVNFKDGIKRTLDFYLEE